VSRRRTFGRSATAHIGVTWFLGTLQGTIGGQPLLARMRYTRTWTHDDRSGWKIIAAHATFLTDQLLDTGNNATGSEASSRETD
jgi:hypothetical protein